MHEIDLSIGKDLYAANRKLAKRIRDLCNKKHVLMIDFMGAIGSGKTLLIEKLIECLKGRRIGVIVGDVTGDDDYQRIKKYGVPVVNINTGKECHLDAHLIEHALEGLNLDDLEILFVENIGNLVCPADFDLGSHKRGVIISVTEGDDMVRKHPLIFQVADFIVINKIDLIPYVDMNIERLKHDIDVIAPKEVFLTNARTSEGISSLAEWLLK